MSAEVFMAAIRASRVFTSSVVLAVFPCCRCMLSTYVIPQETSRCRDSAYAVRFYRAMHFSAKRGIAIACRLSVRLSVCL